MSKPITAANLSAVTLAAVAALSAPAGNSAAAAKCKVVRGHVTSQSVTENCPSPINLCASGDDVSIVTITGGTGKYAGATGRLRAYGTFSESGGEFSYEGELCTT